MASGVALSTHTTAPSPAPKVETLRALASRVAVEILAPNAASIDRDAMWPAAGLRALAESGLMGLHIPRRLGGHGEGLLALAVITEELGAACSSTAMCYGMHCVASRVLASKATADQERRFLIPIVEGRHISSLALSEPGTGIHFFLPRVTFVPDQDDYILEGEKSFVTSGAHADSYVVSAAPPSKQLDPGAFTCLAVEANSPGLRWGEQWQGFGMRGNSSRSLGLDGVRITGKNLLGEQGDQIWYIFEVVAPYFIVAMTGVYVGIARAALECAIAHIKSREHTHTGEALNQIPVLWHEVAQAWTEIEATRQLLLHAARSSDEGLPEAQLALFAAKAKVAKMVAAVTESSMILMGGRGYGANSTLSRLHRDARAANVMSPSTHLLESWLGRSLLGLPLL